MNIALCRFGRRNRVFQNPRDILGRVLKNIKVNDLDSRIGAGQQLPFGVATGDTVAKEYLGQRTHLNKGLKIYPRSNRTSLPLSIGISPQSALRVSGHRLSQPNERKSHPYGFASRPIRHQRSTIPAARHLVRIRPATGPE